MYVISEELISYWNKSNTSLDIKRQFLQSLGLDPGNYEFISNCAYTWLTKERHCSTMSWEYFRKHAPTIVKFIYYPAFQNWQLNRLKETKSIKEDKNVNRLQKQKTQIDRGDFPEGNRIKGRACKASIGVGHLSYQAVKS